MAHVKVTQTDILPLQYIYVNIYSSSKYL